MSEFTVPPYGRKETFNYVKGIITSAAYNSPVIVEIGMTRNVGNWIGDGYSTPFFAYLINITKGELYSVDIDPEVRKTCESILCEYGLHTDRVHLLVEDGISFLKRWHDDVRKPVDLLYLDGWDYAEGRQAEISEKCHLEAFQAIENDLSLNSLILIDDIYDTVTFKGKGRLVIPYLYEKGYKSLYLGYQCLFAKTIPDIKFPQDSFFSGHGKDAILKQIMQEAYEDSIEERTSDLPRNFGDQLLEKEYSDLSIRSLHDKKRKDGVRDDDIRWWWNMDDMQRRMTIKIDLRYKLDEFRKLIEEYELHEDAAKLIIKKTQPVFSEPDQALEAIGDDSPLPYELMLRINNYIKKLQSEPERYKNDLKSSSTFNAFIRKGIREGKL